MLKKLHYLPPASSYSTHLFLGGVVVWNAGKGVDVDVVGRQHGGVRRRALPVDFFGVLDDVHLNGQLTSFAINYASRI